MKYETLNTDADTKFAHQLHLAFYGETYDERENREKALIIEKLVVETRLSYEKIANIVDTNVDEVRAVIKKASKKEKISIIKKLFVKTDWSDEKIADIVDTPLEFINEVRTGKYNSLRYKPIKTDMSFSNQLHLGLYGETYDERRNREKALIIMNLIMKTDLSDEKITDIVNTNIEFVKELRTIIKQVSKELSEKVIKNLFVETDLSDEKIANIIGTTVEFVKEARNSVHKT